MSDSVRVLCVDEPEAASRTAAALERETDRLAVDTASDVETALIRVDETGYDCLVSGSLASKTGIEVLEAVREQDVSSPFVLFADEGDEAAVSEAFAAGVTDYVRKGTGSDQYELLAHRIESVVARRRAERKLKEERRFVDQALDSLTDLFYVVGTDGAIRRWNDRLPEVTGYDDGTIAEMRAVDFVPTDERDRITETIETALATGETTVTADLLTADDRQIPYEFTASRLTDDAGNRLGVVGIGRDITERRERERRLELAETIFQQTQDAIFLVDVDDGAFRVQRVNAAYEELTGLDVEEIRGKTPTEIVGEEEGGEIERRYRDCLERQEPIGYEEELSINGELREWDTKLTPVVEDGDVRKLIGATRDITDRKERERRLLELRQSIETITANVPMVLFAYDDEGVFTRSEGRALETIGFEPGEAVGSSVFDIFADHEEMLGQVRRSLDGEQVHETVEMGDVTFESWYQPVFDDDGTVDRVVGFSLDVTERKERERTLALRKRAIDEAPVGIVITDPARDDNPIIYVNDQFTEMTGYPESAAVGRNCRFLQGENTESESVARMRRAIDATEPVSVELRNYRRDGTEFWNQVTIAPVKDDAGEVTHYVGFQQDVTRRKAFEQSLSALHEATSEFVQAGTTTEAATEIATATSDVSGLSHVVVYLYDEETGVLRPAASSQPDAWSAGSLPEIEPGDGTAWQVFANDEFAWFDDVHDADDAYSPGMELRSELLMPLGEHGLLVAGDPQPAAFDARTRELVEIVAVSAAAALDSIADTERLRARTQQLDRQTRRLDHVNQLNDAIREINRALVDADTREVILQAVCDRIATIELVDFAWIGEPTTDMASLTPRAWTGDDRSYLDALDLPSGTHELAVETVQTRSLGHVPNVASEVQSGTWQTTALQHGFRAALCVPLKYDESLYGVLTVYSADRDVFGERIRDVLAELGDLVGLGINAIDRRDALLGRRSTTLELELGGITGTEQPFLRLSEQLDSQLEITRTLSRDGEYLVYARCRDVTKGSVTDAVELIPGIDRVRRVRGTDPCEEPCLYEFVGTGTDLVTRLADRGIRSGTVSFEGGQCQLVATLPPSVEAATLVSDLRTTYEVDLVETRTEQSPASVSDAFFLTEEVTEAQREAVEAAHEAGFFEWPRDSTSEEIATALGISQPAFAQRLRTAERKIFAAYCRGMRLPDTAGF